jgi:hypothetical protein
VARAVAINRDVARGTTRADADAMRCWIVLAFALVACGTGSQVNGGSDGGDASSEASTNADGGVCCPPDPSPGCCMRYGGWSENGNQCFQVCDGMPQPNDPQWTLTTDSHGCSVWMNPKPVNSPGTCGTATIDSGTD